MKVDYWGKKIVIWCDDCDSDMESFRKFCGGKESCQYCSMYTYRVTDKKLVGTVLRNGVFILLKDESI